MANRRSGAADGTPSSAAAQAPVRLTRREALVGAWMLSLAGCGGGGTSGGAAPPPDVPPPPPPAPPVVAIDGPAWSGFARDAQHSATGAIATQSLQTLWWSTPVDLAPPYSGSGSLLAHYGSPIITRRNTVLVPVKTDATGRFRIDAFVGITGQLLWTLPTDYSLPPHEWVPSLNPALTPDGRLLVPAAGGRVLERADADAPSHNFRGWLLHFDSALAQVRTPGSFGWDSTASIVPRAMVPQYAGPSTYLLALKYNSYAGVGSGDGQHRVVIVDPHDAQADPFARFAPVAVMREVLSVLGPTPDPYTPGGRKEWCINTAAVDPLTSSVLMNSEDGFLYRWHLPSNSLVERLRMNNGYAQSYTPTAIGADGRVYAVNNARLFSIGG